MMLLHQLSFWCTHPFGHRLWMTTSSDVAWLVLWVCTPALHYRTCPQLVCGSMLAELKKKKKLITTNMHRETDMSRNKHLSCLENQCCIHSVDSKVLLNTKYASAKPESDTQQWTLQRGEQWRILCITLFMHAMEKKVNCTECNWNIILFCDHSRTIVVNYC